ncbi:MAG: ACP phosphodiesterase [Verrucomicrobiota bacterium]
MNFLAHLHLAEATPESRLGNLLGDFVRGFPWDERFPTSVWQGIMEHRYVDSFTDRHEVWKRSRDILPREMRRYAGIIVDIFYDFFLHRHWTRFSPEQSLPDFVEEVHSQLSESLALAPQEAKWAIGLMIREEWLQEYASIEGIDRTLYRVSQRAPILLPIRNAVQILEEHTADFESHFLEFYPDLIAYVPEVREDIRKKRVTAV